MNFKSFLNQIQILKPLYRAKNICFKIYEKLPKVQKSETKILK